MGHGCLLISYQASRSQSSHEAVCLRRLLQEAAEAPVGLEAEEAAEAASARAEEEVLAAATAAAAAGEQQGYCDVSELRRLIRQARQVPILLQDPIRSGWR